MGRKAFAHNGLTAPRAGLCLAAGIAVLVLGACQKEAKGPEIPAGTIPPTAHQTTVPGAMTTVVPARTGSQSSGTEGSSTVIGAPPKGQAGTAFAH